MLADVDDNKIEDLIRGKDDVFKKTFKVSLENRRKENEEKRKREAARELAVEEELMLRYKRFRNHLRGATVN